MFPTICVYPSTCTDFSNNGLGVLSPQFCTVTETLNGEYELTLVHPLDTQGKWQRLVEGNILRAPVPAAETPQIKLVSQQYQSTSYDILIYKVVGGRLNLRSGKGTNTKRLGQYKTGTEIIVLNNTGSWYEVFCPDGKHGYMSSQYLEYARTETKSKREYVGFQNETIAPKQLRDQPFRIYRVVPDLNKVTVYARHVFYDLLDNMVKSLKPSPDTVGASVVQSISSECLSEHDFTFYSDLSTTAEEVLFENINPVEAILGEGGVVEKYKAELARDWFDVYLTERVGYDTDVEIRQGKNLLGITYDVDATDVVTRIMPTGEDKDGNILYLPELFIDSPNPSAYPHPKWIHLPVSEAKESEDEDEPKTKAQCYADMRRAVQDEYDKGSDLPTVTLKVDFVDCASTEEYKDYANLKHIFLGDSVRVIAPRIGVAVSMRMTQYTYDCLTKQYTAITLGTVADTLEGSMISTRQLPAGCITGAKLAINSVGAGQLINGSVGSLQIGMAAIGTAHIQQAAITNAQIAEAAIMSANIDNAAVTNAKIADAAIDTAKIGALAVTEAQIADAAITSGKIKDATIRTAHIEDLAVDEAKIGNVSVTTAKIADLAVTRAKIATAAIGSAQIDDAAIGSAKIEDAAITRAKIADLSVDEAKISDLAVTTAKIAQAAITNAKIANAAIDTAQIALGAITSALIEQGAVGTMQIADGSITDAKIVELTANKITAGQLSVERLIIRGNEQSIVYAINNLGELVSSQVNTIDGYVLTERTITADKIVAHSISANEIAAKSITANEILAGTITGEEISADTISASHIQTGAVTTSHVSSDFGEKLVLTGNAGIQLIASQVEAIPNLETRLSVAEQGLSFVHTTAENVNHYMSFSDGLVIGRNDEDTYSRYDSDGMTVIHRNVEVAAFGSDGASVPNLTVERGLHMGGFVLTVSATDGLLMDWNDDA